MNLLVPAMRMRGLRRMIKAYRPSVDLNVCLQQLGLIGRDHDETEGDDVKEGTAFLVSCGVVVKDAKVLSKDSDVHDPIVDKKNSLI